jgi:hypothetical protein
MGEAQSEVKKKGALVRAPFFYVAQGVCKNILCAKLLGVKKVFVVHNMRNKSFGVSLSEVRDKVGVGKVLSRVKLSDTLT